MRCAKVPDSTFFSSKQPLDLGRGWLLAYCLALVVGCGGHKEAAPKEVPKEKTVKVLPPAVVAHLRLDLDRDISDVKTPFLSENKEDLKPEGTAIGKKEAGSISVTPLPSDDTGYKTDKEYLSMKRYEQPVPATLPQETRKELDDSGRFERREKNLVLGGKGFDIQGFNAQARENLNVDTTSRLMAPVLPELPKKEPAHLDLEEGLIKDKRTLIFHDQGAGYFKSEKIEIKEEKPKKPQPKVTAPSGLEIIPETKLRMSQGKDNQLTLSPNERGIDLLMGNEELSRKIYDNK